MNRFQYLCIAPLVLLWFSSTAVAGDGVELLKIGPPAKDLSASIAKAISGNGYKVTAGGKVVCEIWLAKQWDGKAKFKPSLSVLYPFQPGELIGVIRYLKRAGDFRDQQVKSGVYTIRYGLQPEDGNHIGTSDTRDFLVLLPPSKDKNSARLTDMAKLFEHSAEVSQATHPAILSMLSIPAKAKAPAVRHLEERKLWSVRLVGKAKAGKSVKNLSIEFVVVGHGEE